MFIGVDGCRAGWAVATLGAEGGWADLRIVDAFSTVLAMPAQAIWVDIPIGLPANTYGRDADEQAQQYLGARRSTIFRVPTRAAIYADDYRGACEVNQVLTGKMLSKQTWCITPKIREVDALLPTQAPLFETHPEVIFAALNGDVSLATKKNRIEGRTERLALIFRHVESPEPLLDGTLAATRRKDVQPNDLIDAMVCAVGAYLAHQNGTISMPSPPAADEHGLPMRILRPRLRTPNSSH